MEFELGPQFVKDFGNLDPPVQERVRKKLKQFAANPAIRGFRAKPMQGYAEIWEAHISKSLVFTFEWDASLPVEKRTVFLRRIGNHEIYRSP